jgi:hypothetical protein
MISPVNSFRIASIKLYSYQQAMSIGNRLILLKFRETAKALSWNVRKEKGMDERRFRVGKTPGRGPALGGDRGGIFVPILPLSSGDRSPVLG